MERKTQEEFRIECIVPFSMNGRVNWGKYSLISGIDEKNLDVCMLESMLDEFKIFRIGKKTTSNGDFVYYQSIGNEALIKVFMTPQADEDLKRYIASKGQFDVYG